MIKRLLLSFFVAVAAVLGIEAQGTGSWTIMPVYGGVAERVVETPRLVYYLSKGHLFSYNKETDETMHYSTVNKLNDVHVQDVAYNPFKGYLAIVYDTHNIDLLYDNGRIVNLPDIRDANISAEKTVNAVNFSKNGRMYVATGFGFVAFDDEKHRVADSGIYNKAATFAGEVDSHLVLEIEGTLYASPVDARHNSLNSFASLGQAPGSQHVFCPLGDRLLAMRAGNPATASCTYYVVTPDFDATSIATQRVDAGALRMDFTRAADGRVRLAHGTVSRLFDVDGTCKVEYLIPSVLVGKTIATERGEGDVWVSDESGVAHYLIENGELTQLSAPSKPASLTCYWPAFMFLSDDGNRIYVTNCGYDAFKNEIASPCFTVKQTTNIIEQNSVRDVSCYNIDGTGKQMTGGTTVLAEYPDDPSVYFITNYQKGIYVIKDGEQIGKIGKGQLPYTDSWAQWMYDIQFDKDGNLWMCVWKAETRRPVYVLPSEKLKDLESIKPSDWVVPNTGAYSNASGIISLHHSKSNFVLCGSNHGATNFLVLDHGGTPLDPSDDKPYVFTHYVDQDGNETKINRVFSFHEDSRGYIWIGMQSGVVVIPDITKAIQNNTLHVRRPKVPRNDGTNFADYLLDGVYAMGISSDPAGRKWIATYTSGVYLVNEDGTEIIEHFTTENSQLPSDKMFSVMADPHGNKVYMGTDKGVVCYTSDAAPGADDYSDVYAYPNPVRPEYTGWITITGLMDDSLVKITDAAGNLVCQGRSEGGVFLWDGCNSANQRVRSGVYYVFASQNASGSSSGKAATKILVIN